MKRLSSIVLVLLVSVFVSQTAVAAKKTANAKMTDAQIVAVVMAANTGEVDAANAAVNKTENEGVKGFAQQMITDHTKMNDDTKALATKLNITPEENATSKKLKDTNEKEMTKMQGLSGSAFDKAYVDAQVTDHTTVLSMLDKTLIPNAQNDELKSALKDARTKVSTHLQHAKQLQASLKKGGGVKATMNKK